jgi:A/G-specific adenine glycosylase
MERTADLPKAARESILAWYREHGRTLAFRRTTDPYAVLVAETMAQQTQAARAASYWERFLDRFPSVGALAAASPADVLREWQGLGYDRRALNLWRAARVVVDRHGGRLPEAVGDLDALPGIGPYTARAVAAIAFGRPVGAVDVNVRRVLGRIVAGDRDALPARQMQTLADRAVPPNAPGTWTHAVMDLGAIVCLPRRPRCEVCPVRDWCRYAAGALPSTAPRRAPLQGPTPAFRSTNRWLRGRILDRLRAAPGEAWVNLDEPIGDHDLDRVRAAANSMANDGLIELAERADTRAVRARLATA